MPNRTVIDLSHWNTVRDFAAIKAAGVVGIIHKATQGNYNSDEKYNARRNGAREAGLLFGAYHFATNNSVEEQVSRFLGYAKPDQDMLVALDWEDYKNETMELGQVKEWITRVEAALKRPNSVVLYTGNTVKDQLGTRKDAFLGARRLWLAQYANVPTVQASWPTYWLWQYSDGEHGPEPRNCPGVDNPTDTNSWQGTADELIAEWPGWHLGPGPKPEPEPEPDVKTVTINVVAPAGVKVIVNVNES